MAREIQQLARGTQWLGEVRIFSVVFVVIHATRMCLIIHLWAQSQSESSVNNSCLEFLIFPLSISFKLWFFAQVLHFSNFFIIQITIFGFVFLFFHLFLFLSLPFINNLINIPHQNKRFPWDPKRLLAGVWDLISDRCSSLVNLSYYFFVCLGKAVFC